MAVELLGGLKKQTGLPPEEPTLGKTARQYRRPQNPEEDMRKHTWRPATLVVVVSKISILTTHTQSQQVEGRRIPESGLKSSRDNHELNLMHLHVEMNGETHNCEPGGRN